MDTRTDMGTSTGIQRVGYEGATTCTLLAPLTFQFYPLHL